MIEQMYLICNQHVDKFAHFGISIFLFLFFYAITKKKYLSAGFTFGISLIKEISDYARYQGISFGDIFFGIAGIIISLILIEIILRRQYE